MEKEFERIIAQSSGGYLRLDPPIDILGRDMTESWNEFKLEVIFRAFYMGYYEKLPQEERRTLDDLEVYSTGFGETQKFKDMLTTCQMPSGDGAVGIEGCIMVFGDSLCAKLEGLCHLQVPWFGEDENQWYDDILIEMDRDSGEEKRRGTKRGRDEDKDKDRREESSKRGRTTIDIVPTIPP